MAELGANALITDRPAFIREQIITGDCEGEGLGLGDEDLDVPLQASSFAPLGVATLAVCFASAVAIVA